MPATGSGAGKGNSHKGASKPRSLGAAAGKPNGAILDDGEEQRRKRFKSWAKNYREVKLKPNKHEALYPQPVDWK